MAQPAGIVWTPIQPLFCGRPELQPCLVLDQYQAGLMICGQVLACGTSSARWIEYVLTVQVSSQAVCLIIRRSWHAGKAFAVTTVPDTWVCAAASGTISCSCRQAAAARAARTSSEAWCSPGCRRPPSWTPTGSWAATGSHRTPGRAVPRCGKQNHIKTRFFKHDARLQSQVWSLLHQARERELISTKQAAESRAYDRVSLQQLAS